MARKAKPLRWYGHEIEVLGDAHVSPAGRPMYRELRAAYAKNPANPLDVPAINPKGQQIAFQIKGTNAAVETTLDDPGFRRGKPNFESGILRPIRGGDFESRWRAWFNSGPLSKSYKPALRMSEDEQFSAWKLARASYVLELADHPERFELRGMTLERALAATGCTVEWRTGKRKAHVRGRWREVPCQWRVIKDADGNVLRETEAVPEASAA